MSQNPPPQKSAQSNNPVVEPKNRVEDGLLAAHEFISSVTQWTGHEDDRDEALTAVNDALFALERI